MADAALTKEFEFFKANQDSLVAEHDGKYIVIKDQKVVGAFNTELEAYNDAKQKFALGTFLIQHCIPGSESYTQTFHSRVSAQ